jgi:hypothetical protein
VGIFIHNLVSKFAKHLHNSKFGATAAIATFAPDPDCKVNANLFFQDGGMNILPRMHCEHQE